jgi:hypothetical protein
LLMEKQTAGQVINPNDSTQPTDNAESISAPTQYDSVDSTPVTQANEEIVQQDIETNLQPPVESADQETQGVAPLASWTASEYIAHRKGTSWYMGLAAATGLLAAAVYLLTRDIISTSVVVIVGLLFGVFAARQPSVLDYSIHDSGLQIGNKFYPFTDFKSFTVQEESALPSIYLLPLKRFLPGLTIYFPPDQEDAVIAAFADYLPHEERQLDVIDRLMHKIGF